MRGLAGRSLLFSMGGFAQRVVGVVLVPYLARTLTVGDVGRLEVLSVLSTTTSTIGLLGLDVVVTRRWADVDDDGRRRSFATWLSITGGFGAAALLASILLADPLSRAFFGSTEHAGAIRFAGVGVLANLVLLLGLTALRNQDRPRTYAAVAVASAVGNGVLVVVLVQQRQEVASVLLAGALALSIGAATVLWCTRQVVLGQPSRAEASTLLRAGLPLVPGIALTAGADLASRFILLESAGAAAVGQLSIALRFAGIGLLLLVSFQLAWHPRAYAVARHAEGVPHLRRDGRAAVASLSLLAVGLAAFGPELLELVGGDRYVGAVGVLGWAVVVPVAAALLAVSTLPFAIAGTMGHLGVATAVAALATVALSVPLSGAFEATGAAAALAIGPLAGAAVAALLASRDRLAAVVSWRGAVVAALAGAAALCLAMTASSTSLGLRVLTLAAAVAAVGLLERDLTSTIGRVLRTERRERG